MAEIPDLEGVWDVLCLQEARRALDVGGHVVRKAEAQNGQVILAASAHSWGGQFPLGSPCNFSMAQ